MHAAIQRIMPRMGSLHITVLLWCLLFSLIPRPLLARTAVHIAPAIKEQTRANTPQERYNLTKGKVAQLLISDPSTHDRNDWHALAITFGDLFFKNKQSDLGPTSLFMQARTFHFMFERYHLEEDAESARKAFLQVAELYPRNTLSDDALYKAAILTNFCKLKTPSAESLYQKIIKEYPKGDYLPKAELQLQLSRATQDQDAQVTTTNIGGQTKEAVVENANFAQIGQSKFWTSDRYSRVIISSNKTIPYGVQQKDSQLFVDLQQSKINPKFSSEQKFDSGLLQQIRPLQMQADSVRFELDLQPFEDYKVFTLDDPFRIVVDVYGAQETVPSQTATAESSDNKTEKTVKPGPIPLLTDFKKRSQTNSAIPRIKSAREHISLAQQLGLGVKTIVIDPGHGGKDPGAMAFGLKEKEITLKISKKLAEFLTKNFHYQVTLTRTKDVYIPLEKRITLANSKKADLFVSIHVNAHPNPTNNGIETYFLNLATDADAMRVAALENASSTHSIGELQDILSSLMNNSKIDESSRLARFVQTNLVNGFAKPYKPRDLGVKQAPFYVLIGAEMPAILAELSFITNAKEAALLKDDAHLEKLAQKLAGGIVAYIDHHRAAVRLN